MNYMIGKMASVATAALSPSLKSDRKQLLFIDYVNNHLYASPSKDYSTEMLDEMQFEFSGGR